MSYHFHPPHDGLSQLTQTLLNLRTRWPGDWPGLPVVVDSCAAQLWTQISASSSQTQTLVKAALAMASDMETMAQSCDHEPDYHNRLHTADALVSLCWMLKLLKTDKHVVPDEWAAALLLAVASHDVLHPGGANSYLQEFEQQSVNQFQQLAARHGIDDVWVQRISQLILLTDPSLVSANHDKVKAKAFVFDLDWAVVLVNEADILASATSHLGPGLGLQLAQEWKYKQHRLHSVVGTDAGRLNFLRSLRFSSPASIRLGIRQAVDQQIQALDKPLNG